MSLERVPVEEHSLSVELRNRSWSKDRLDVRITTGDPLVNGEL